ncbi:MAG: CocE/NonD family hydrolase [Chloroflexota bacterium]|nr:CocE/NonD family hydrolase [Chloroflexota bacterium]
MSVLSARERQQLLSPAAYEVRAQFDVKMKARDGVRLSNDIYLPHAAGPFPTIVTRTPYENSRDVNISWGIFYARRGYAAVIQDTRGRYDSEGEFYPWRSDADDGDDTFEWVFNQAWCNGKIGTWGRSYGGVNQWYSMPRSNPHISAMSPQVTPADNWESAHYVNGASQWGLNTLIVPVWNVSLSAAGRADLFDWDSIFRILPLRDADLAMIGRRCDYFQDWYAHPTYDQYWESFRWDDKYDRVHVPVRNQCGWYDAYPGATFKAWRGAVDQAPDPAVKRQQRVLMGPWSHADPTSSRLGELDFGATAFRRLWLEDLRWYDATLRDIDNGLLDEPRIELFVMGANEWRHEDEWPLARTQFAAWYLHSGGRANSLYGDGRVSTVAPDRAEPPDHYTYDPELPVPTLGGNHSMGGWPGRSVDPVPVGPLDQRPIERRDDVLVFTSEPLSEDTEVTGPIAATLYAASSARDTDWVLKLVDVYPDGRAIVLADGIRRARYRRGRVPPELIQPGEVYGYQVELAPTSNVFKAGHRIRVDVTSSNFPRFDRNLNTGEDIGAGTRMQSARQTVFHTHDYPSHILLPMIPR